MERVAHRASGGVAETCCPSALGRGSLPAVPVWITSLALLAANLSAQEVIGMAASGAKCGIMTAGFSALSGSKWCEEIRAVCHRF